MASNSSGGMLRECFRMTRDFRAHWKELGLLLKVEKCRLDEIQKNNLRDVAECMMDMLDIWLKSGNFDCKAELDAALDELHRTVHVGEQNIITCVQHEFDLYYLYFRRGVSKTRPMTLKKESMVLKQSLLI